MKKNNIAYIDGANLHLGVSSSNWKLDYKKFRGWLRQKYSIMDAYIFLGNIPMYSNLYNYLQKCGFKVIFKQVIYDGEGKAKGNCDADLVLKSVVDFYENKYDKMLLISSDGDYSSLVTFLNEKNKFVGLLSSYGKDKCSILLKRTNVRISYLEDFREKLHR